MSVSSDEIQPSPTLVVSSATEVLSLFTKVESNKTARNTNETASFHFVNEVTND